MEWDESALTDPDPQVRARALNVWVRTLRGGPEPIRTLLDDAPAETRFRLYRVIRAARRTDLAEEFIAPVRTRFGDVEAACLLTACAPATIARLLPELSYALPAPRTFARHHPEAVLREAARELAELPVAGRPAWWSRCSGWVLAAAPARPAETLELLERYAPADRLPGDLTLYGVLAAADPSRLRALLTAPARAGWLGRSFLPGALLDRLGRLAPAELQTLARRIRHSATDFAGLLDAVAPSRREELFELALSDVDRSGSRIADVVLAVLPWRLRVAEARRMLALDEVRQSERLTLHYTAHLPWAEAEEPLLAATRRAQPDERGAAWELLVACAARGGDPAAVLAATHHLLRLRNEQDPVRGRAVAALAKVKPALLRPEMVEPLEQVVTDAVQSRDSSGATLSQLTALAVVVLREKIESPVLVSWAQHTFQRLLGDDRVPPLGRLDTRLRRGQEAQAFEAVRSWLVNSADRAKYEPLFAVTRALGRRAWRLPGLQALLERGTRRGNLADVSRTAVELWLADRRGRDARVGAVLREDPSAIAIPAVWRAVANRRTDLLDAVLSGPSPKGRFLPAGVQWVPPRPEHIRRWSRTQRQSYAGLLAALAHDPGQSVPARARAIRLAALVPEFGWPIAHGFVDSPDLNLAEAALAALAWTDRPGRALPILLSHAGDDRARVAMYAAGRVARFVPPSVLLASLRTLTGKVTSRKVAVRLLADLAVPGAAGALWELWQSPGLHRDVRAAIVAAAGQRAEDPGMWPILRAAAAGGEREDARAVLAAGPYTVPAGLRADYARLVASACASADREVAIAAWRAFPAWARWLPDASAQVLARLRDLDDRNVWQWVVGAVVELVVAELGDALLAETVTTLAALDDRPTGPTLDRPARRRLEMLVDRLAVRVADAPQGAPVRGTLRTAAGSLSTVEGFAPLAAKLLLEGIDVASAEAVTGLLDLAADRPVLAGRLATALQARLHRMPETPPDVLHRIAVELAARPGPAAGLFALAYAGLGRELGWPARWRAVVEQLRAHPVADVRDAALTLPMDQS
jgi:hypothetical protein